MDAMASRVTILTIVYSTIYSGADQRKRQSSASLAFVRGIHRWPGQRASNAENVSIWWRHHEEKKRLCWIPIAILSTGTIFMSRKYVRSWWRHQMETFFALLAICAGNSPAPVNCPHKGQWCGALMLYLVCARINGWVNNREAGDLRLYRAHYDVIVMFWITSVILTNGENSEPKNFVRRPRMNRNWLSSDINQQGCLNLFESADKIDFCVTVSIDIDYPSQCPPQSMVLHYRYEQCWTTHVFQGLFSWLMTHGYIAMHHGGRNELTRSDWATHICISKLWSNSGLMLVGPMGINFNGIWIKTHIKINFKMPPAKSRPLCSDSKAARQIGIGVTDTFVW